MISRPIWIFDCEKHYSVTANQNQRRSCQTGSKVLKSGQCFDISKANHLTIRRCCNKQNVFWLTTADVIDMSWEVPRLRHGNMSCQPYWWILSKGFKHFHRPQILLNFYPSYQVDYRVSKPLVCLSIIANQKLLQPIDQVWSYQPMFGQFTWRVTSSFLGNYTLLGFLPPPLNHCSNCFVIVLVIVHVLFLFIFLHKISYVCMYTEKNDSYGVGNHSRFQPLAVGLRTYSPWIQGHYCPQWAGSPPSTKVLACSNIWAECSNLCVLKCMEFVLTEWSWKVKCTSS